jgi:uncharacterized membrane protein
MFPPLPPWEGMHPLLIHLPIGLALVAPLPALLALVMPSRRHAFLSITLAVVLIATVGALVAVLSGEAAEESVEDRGLETPAVHHTLEEHEEHAETVRTALLILSFVTAGVVIGGRKGKLAGAPGAIASAVLLLGTLAVILLVAQTAHYGGELVHYHGIRAPLGPSVDAPADHDDD